MVAAADVARPKAAVITFNSTAQARGHFERSKKLTLLGGGLYSGKSFLHAVDLLERGRRRRDEAGKLLRGSAETDQLGAIFTNTQNTLQNGVFGEIAKLFKLLGKPMPVFDRQPPRSWVKQWIREGIEIPAVPRYRNMLTTCDGVHVVCGTLHHQSYHQYETLNLGWARLEEAINNSREATETMTERVRCSSGGRSNPDCALYHRHTCHWIFNPPRGAHPWLFTKLDELEAAAMPYYHALADGQTCDGCSYVPDDEHPEDSIPREHGPELQHREWPLLSRGIGEAIWIRSKTSDNAANQNRGYRAGLAANMSKETARRRLDGEIVREQAGRAYTEFSSDNVRPVGYDADRTLYVGLDFNLQPRAAVFSHPLVPGEYDAEHARPGVTHIGVFGEYFYAGEMADRRFALELVKGGRGNGFDSQPKYRSEEWRGLPRPCDDACVQPCRAGHWNGLKAHRGKIVAFGDQRGTHRSSHGDNNESSWQIVEQVFRSLKRYGSDVPEVQPSPRARVDSVNAKLLSSLDVISLWIDPRCEELIRDFEQVMWDESGMALREWRRGSMGTEWHRTHLSDGLGYELHRLFPIGREANDGGSGTTIDLPERVRIPTF